MTRLPPKLLEEHLRRTARAMRECYSARCASDYEDAANCIASLRLGNTPRERTETVRYEVDKAIGLIRGANPGRALRVLLELRAVLDDLLAPVNDE